MPPSFIWGSAASSRWGFEASRAVSFVRWQDFRFKLCWQLEQMIQSVCCETPDDPMKTRCDNFSVVTGGVPRPHVAFLQRVCQVRCCGATQALLLQHQCYMLLLLLLISYCTRFWDQHPLQCCACYSGYGCYCTVYMDVLCSIVMPNWKVGKCWDRYPFALLLHHMQLLLASATEVSPFDGECWDLTFRFSSLPAFKLICL